MLGCKLLLLPMCEKEKEVKCSYFTFIFFEGQVVS